MGLLQTVGTGDYRDVNEWYSGTIDSIEETDHPKYGSGLKWIVYLDTDDGSDYPETWAFTSQQIAPRTKVYRWLTGIYGRSPAVGASIDLGKLFGTRVQVQFAPHSKIPDKQVVSDFRGLDEPREVPRPQPAPTQQERANTVADLAAADQAAGPGIRHPRGR